MSDKDRAKKLAAAKKKLKAYQSTEKHSVLKDETKHEEAPKLENYFDHKSNNEDFLCSSAPTFFDNARNGRTSPKLIDAHFPENHSENINSNDQSGLLFQTNFGAVIKENTSLDTSLHQIYDSKSQPESIQSGRTLETGESNEIFTTNTTSSKKSDHIQAIELLIAEKAELSSQLSKSQTSCKEKDFELEEINTRLKSCNSRVEELEQHFFAEQKKNLDLIKSVQSLEIDLSRQKTNCDEFSEHVEELKRELSFEKTKNIELQKEIKEKNSQLELNNIRINQISDETNITIDNRIESLTQTKFMYEQQIVDLQTMVQQLRTEKEQANQQYQNYVQHLNKDISTLSEKNSELLDENSKLLGRERDLIDHVSNLEKQIQQNIAKSESLKDNQKSDTSKTEEFEVYQNELKGQIDMLEKSREELNVLISKQNDKLSENQALLQEKSNEIVTLEERLVNLESERPNDAKLMATIESDKVAASRAMTQNAELRKQLDEVQLKLIELTNDKMDLTNLLDSEKHANKEIRFNFEDFQSQNKSLTDQLHFKDEEMIRLIHENNNLNEKILDVQNSFEQIKAKQLNPSQVVNSLKSNLEDKDTVDNEDIISNDFPSNINGDTTNDFHNHESQNQTIEITENSVKRKDSDTFSIPTTEAMHRLEERFKRLMGEVADLSDEKQRLEHLVLQLQSETDTIGEYIALYQSQRKILKQKENERDAQLNRLLAEREDLRAKALQLNTLISQLGLKSGEEISSSLAEIFQKKSVENNVIEESASITNGYSEKFTDNDHNNHHHNNTTNLSDSKKIVDQIQSLLSDLKDHTDTLPSLTPSVDHCACCSGKLETI